MLHEYGKNTNMPNHVLFKAKHHGWTLETGKYTINWFDCSQLPPSIVFINEVQGSVDVLMTILVRIYVKIVRCPPLKVTC